MLLGTGDMGFGGNGVKEIREGQWTVDGMSHCANNGTQTWECSVHVFFYVRCENLL